MRGSEEKGMGREGASGDVLLVEKGRDEKERERERERERDMGGIIKRRGEVGREVGKGIEEKVMLQVTR